MPTYDYVCGKCGHQFEEIQKMSDPPLTKCPECKGKVKRLIGGGIGVIFKGSGFYVTDSRSSSASKSPSTAPKSENAAEKPKTTKAETKTETKSGTSKSD